MRIILKNSYQIESYCFLIKLQIIILMQICSSFHVLGDEF